MVENEDIMTNHGRVLVTGGAGFLGSNVAAALLKDDYSVVILDNFSNGKMLHLEKIKNHPNLKIVRGDIVQKDVVRDAMKDCQYVIHLAVLDLRQSIKEPAKVNDVIVNGTMNCLEVSLENDIRLFLNCSSSEVYGTANYIPMDEKHPLHPETPYAAAKVAQDMYVYSYGRTYGLQWTTIRPFNMYGPNSHWQRFRGELIPKMIVRAMNDQPLPITGNGTETRDWTYVEDIVDGLLRMGIKEEAIGEAINLGSGHDHHVKDMAEMINGLTGNKSGIKYTERRDWDVKTSLLSSIEKAQNILGYKPKMGFKDGLKKTHQWFIDNWENIAGSVEF